MIQKLQLILCGLFLAGYVQAAKQPNIVLILSDDQAWTDYGFIGHPDIDTPQIDKLAASGLRFDRGYVAAPVCRPSLASMVTGLFPFDHGVTGNDVRRGGEKSREEQDLPLREKFYQHPGFIEYLTSNGYLAHQSGKWWEGSWKDGGFTHGQKMAGRHGSKESLAIGRTGLQPITDFIDQSIAKEKPFFVWYAPFLPHTPHTPPERLLKKYTQPGRAKDVAKYYAMCEWLDETCGELVGYLEDKQVLENTMILYICDNGWAARSENQHLPQPSEALQRSAEQFKAYAMRSKATPYENGIRSPILISWPGKVNAENSPDFAHAIDLFPTIAAAAGLPVPDGLPGINLLDEEARSARKTIFGTCYSSHNVDLSNADNTLQYLWCIDGDWKLLERYDGVDTSPNYQNLHIWDTKRVQLFNLKDDPHETEDLAGQYPERVEQMKALIRAWHVPTMDAGADAQ